jgi:hypothetical protein
MSFVPLLVLSHNQGDSYIRPRNSLPGIVNRIVWVSGPINPYAAKAADSGVFGQAKLPQSMNPKSQEILHHCRTTATPLECASLLAL